MAIMALRILAVVLAVTSAAWSALPEEPCYGESCTNFTVFLGPKFGAKTIRPPVQNHTELKLNVDGIKKVDNGTKYQSGTDPIKPDPNARPLFPRHRPVSEDGVLSVDYLDVDKERFTFGTDKSDRHNKSATDDVNQLLVSGYLNLSGLGLTGVQAKQLLHNLSNSSKSQLTHLTLSRNQLKSLPVLFFPVELEYGLQELCLDDNPLGRIDSRTSFELSRLGNLKKLSLARTGIHYILEPPHIPSLEVLDLSGNALSNIPTLPETFPNLRELNLSGNNITFLECHGTISRLQILDLSSNGMKIIRAKSIVDTMPFLQTLYLNNNSLKYSYVIEDLSFGATLYLAGNPWQCSCPLVTVVQQRNWPVISDKEALRCTDDNIKVPWPVMSLREVDMTVACPPRGFRGWLRGVGSKFDEVLWWFRYQVRYNFTFSTFFNLLWWVLLICTAVTCARILHRMRRESSHANLPYNILDDKLDNKHFI